MLNIVAWLIIGGIIGWCVSVLTRTAVQPGTWLNIGVGTVGAFLAGLVLTPLLGIGAIDAGEFNLSALIVSLLGAVILLAVVTLFRWGTAR